MEVEHLEDILRESFPAPDAAAARERILNRAARELRPVRSRFQSVARWAFAAAAATILLANVSDHARQVRLANRDCGVSERSGGVLAITERRRLTEDMLVWVRLEPEPELRRKPL